MKLSEADIKAIAKEVAKELAMIQPATLGIVSEAETELTTREVAALLKVSIPTVERLTASNEIPSYKVGRQRRYNREAVLERFQVNQAANN